MNVVKYLGLVVLLVIGNGCASKSESSISQALVDEVSLAQARSTSEAYLGSTVRWGGIVTEVENKADKTWIFLVGRKLSNNDKPVSDGPSDGRFIASFSGFIDPLVYKPGRPLTVVGSIDGSTVRLIGEYDYQFPIVTVRDSHLWAEPVKTKVIYAPAPVYDYYYYHPYPYRYRRW